MFRSSLMRWFPLMPLLDDPDPAGGGGGGGGEEKKFTQKDLDAAIAARLRDVKPAAIVPPEVQKELEDLRQAQAERERKEHEAKGNYHAALKSKDDEIVRVRTEYDAKVNKVTDRLRDKTVTAALVAAAAAGQAHTPEQVAPLLAHRLRLNDDFAPWISGEDGTTTAFQTGASQTAQ
mgnify:CR=1 FL=1